MGEGFPFGELKPETKEPINGEQQNEFIDAVCSRIVSPEDLYIKDASGRVQERHDLTGRDGAYAWFAASRTSAYQPDGVTQVTCKATPNEISLEYVAKGLPLAGYPGLFYAMSEVYVVGQEAPEEKGQFATRYSDHVVVPLCIDAAFHQVSPPEGIELMTPTLRVSAGRSVADPDAQAIYDVSAGVAGELVFAQDDLDDVRHLLDALSPDNLVS